MLTAFYTGRAFFLTFFGPEKLPSPDDPEAEAEPMPTHGHGPTMTTGTVTTRRMATGTTRTSGTSRRPIMTYPLIVLAVCAVAGRACLRADRTCSSITWSGRSGFE